MNLIYPKNIFKLLITSTIVILIWDVYIKAMLKIRIGSILSLYKDFIIYSFLLFFVCTFFLNPKKLIKTKIDIMMSLFVLYGIFEIFWTYLLTGSTYLGIFRFRLYFTAYLIYFPCVYFMRKHHEIVPKLLKFILVIPIACFIWAIVEFFVINGGIIENQLIKSYMKDYISIGTTSYGIIERGLGVLGSVTQSGIIYAVFLAFIYPTILQRKGIKYKIYGFIGIAAVILSMSKTAWLLMLIIFLMSSIQLKKKAASFLILVLSLVTLEFMYKDYSWFSSSLDAGLLSQLHYYESLRDFYSGSWANWLFGFGYELAETESQIFGISAGGRFTESVGPEFFLISLMRQSGILGIFIYSFLFLIIPCKLFWKNEHPVIKGFSLAIIVAGLSCVHYNSIFRNGVNIVVCFFLANLSITYDDSYYRRITLRTNKKNRLFGKTFYAINSQNV